MNAACWTWIVSSSVHLPEFAVADDRRDQVTFRMLLAHSSGCAWGSLYKKATNRRICFKLRRGTLCSGSRIACRVQRRRFYFAG